MKGTRPFIRPAIGQPYIDPNGQVVTVAATWEQGVVFLGERCASADELLRHYRPITPNKERALCAG